MATKDISQKTLEAYNDVFADILNGFLFHGEQVIDPSELEDQTPRAIYKARGALHEIERDCAKRWKKNGIRIACGGIENQSEADEYMTLRTIGYDGAEYQAQVRRREGRYPVFTIVLHFGFKRRWDKPTRLLDALDVPEVLRPFVNDYKIHVFDVAFLEKEQLNWFHSDFRIVADYFVQRRMNGDYEPNTEQMTHVMETLELLSAMTEDRRFLEAYNDSRKGEIRNMCDVLDRIETRGKMEGLALGRAEGRAEGRIEGIGIGVLKAYWGMVLDGDISAQKAAAKLHMTTEEFMAKAEKAAKLN